MNNQIQSQAIDNHVLYLIILLEGFVTIAFEILTIRQLIPVVGNSVVVTSLIIGIFLLFLAYGYRKGGTYTSNYISIIKYNFTVAAFGVGVGLSYGFIKAFFLLTAKLFWGNVFISLILYLLIITAPLVYLLGQTVPITLNLCKQPYSVGALGGKVLHISTLGSFLGAVLTSLLLMNYLGVAWTVFINYFILAVLVLMLLELPREINYLFLLVASGVLVYGTNIYLEKKLFVLTDNYANYQVIDSHDEKLLLINDSASSAINKQLQGFPYIEYIRKLLFTDLHLQGKNILVLGAGGFTLSAGETQANRFTYIDIDPKIKPIVEHHFLAPVKGEFISADARAYLHKAWQSFDVVVGDTYSNQTAIPAHLLTREYFIAVAQALKPDGIAVFNIIARPTLADSYSKGIDNTIRSVFKNCMAVPLHYTAQPTNIIYICKKTLSEKDDMVYTDNMNRATLDYFKFH